MSDVTRTLRLWRAHELVGGVGVGLWMSFHLWEQWSAFGGRGAFAVRSLATSHGALPTALELLVGIAPALVWIALEVHLHRLRSEPDDLASAMAEHPALARRLGTLTRWGSRVFFAWLLYHAGWLWLPKLLEGSDPIRTWLRLSDEAGMWVHAAPHAIGLAALTIHLWAAFPRTAVVLGWARTPETRRASRLSGLILAVGALLLWTALYGLARLRDRDGLADLLRTGTIAAPMGRVWAIAINTFREAVRDKVLYGVLAFASAILLLTLALAELSLNQQRRVVLDVGLASISLFAVVISIFLGSSLLYKEIERKTLYVILPKPIRRWEFLVGKYLGIVVTASVFIAVMGAIQLWVTSIQAGAHPGGVVALALGGPAVLGLAMWRVVDRTAVVLPWSIAFLGAAAALCATTDVDLVPILAALLLDLGEVLVLGSVALLFSSFSTPFLTGVLSFGVWIVGRSADEMAHMRSRAISESIKAALRGLAHVVPNFHLFAPGHQALSGAVPIEGGLAVYLGTTMAYAVAYATLLLMLAALIFRRRDFL